MDNTSNGMPQFATAEFTPAVTTTPCAACHRSFDGSYYQVNAARICPECAEKIKLQTPTDSHSAFARAVIFGIGGALVGLAIYVIFALTTGLVIGWVSLAVGFIVGKAMSFGSRGVGGRRYQIVAVVLTYLAVSLSAVPIAMHQMKQHRQEQASHASAPQAAPMSVAKAIGVLTLMGIASPLLELQSPLHGLLGLVILFVGIRFAWQFTADRSVQVSGPYSLAIPGVI